MARAGGDRRRRRSTCGWPSATVMVAAALAAASSIERALIGSTSSTSVLGRHVSRRVPQRNCPLLGLTGKIRRNSYVGKKRLTIGKRIAITRQYALDHRLLG